MRGKMKKVITAPEPASGIMRTVGKTLYYIGSYKYWMILSLILAAATVIMTLYIPILVGHAVDLITGEGQVDFDGLVPIVIRIGILAALTALLQWLMQLVNNMVAYRVVRDIRNSAFSRIQSLPFSYLDRHAHGEIVSLVVADADQFSDGLLMGFAQLFTAAVTIVGTLIFMIKIHPLIALVVIVLTPISLLVARRIAVRSHALFREQSIIRAEQTAYIEEMIGNQKIVKAFAHEDEAVRGFDEINERLSACSKRAVFVSSLTNPVTRWANSCVYAAVAFAGAMTVIGGGMSVGALTSFLAYANQYTRPFNEISGVIAELQNALACAERIFAFIEGDECADEREKLAEGEAEADGSIVLEKCRGRIDLCEIDFTYGESEGEYLFHKLSLHVDAGEHIALVGSTGCGKTTLLELLMRFYVPQGGRILIDGTDIRDIEAESLRKNFGMVLQDTWLESGTIRENISLGKPDATDEEIENAARLAGADGFIRRLPDGYDTWIGEDDESLSQGQRQLIAIVRVMLTDPAILILDEATSFVDLRTERQIQEAMLRLMSRRTCILVAHRLSSVRCADRILVMRQGEIIETGTHEELLGKGGVYAKMYRIGEADGA